MNGMQMTKENIETYLANEFAGKKWDGYGYAYDIFKAIQRLLPAADAAELAYSTKACGRNGISISYGKGKACFLYVEAHKKLVKRGNSSKHWYYHVSAEYEYNNFEVFWLAEGQTLGEKIAEAGGTNNKILDQKEAYKMRAVELLEHIMDEYDLSDYDARGLCAYIDKNFYSLQDLVRKKAA